MRDCKELVSELRESAEWADRLAVLMGRDAGDSKASLMRKAADAIEELLDELTTIRKQFPRWISVEERLPDYLDHVLCVNKYGSSILSADIPIYDECERHDNCVVEVWRNSVTGEVSVGWWPNDNKPIGTKEGN